MSRWKYINSLLKRRRAALSSGHRQLRSLRLLQIFWALELTLAVLVVHWIYTSDSYYVVNLLLAALALFGVRFYARRGRNELAATILLLVLSLLVSFQVWAYNGLGDEALFAFPIILIFAAVLGSKRLFLSLLCYDVVLFLALAWATENGYRIDYPTSSSYDTVIVLISILLIGAYSVWLMSSDLQLFLERLSLENKKVKQSEDKIRKLVHHDALTGLPNRILVRDRFDQAIKQRLREHQKVGLIFMDIDNFKHINDSLGHQVGDEYLIEIASRLLNVVRESDTVSRQGGDEFLILVQSVRSDEDLINIAEKILKSISEPVSIKGHKLVTTCSLGIATVPDDGRDFDTLCQKADVSMYRSKEQGKNSYFFYNESVHENVLENLAIISEMKNALNLNQFELYLQPKVDLHSLAVTGAECLLRWHHPFRKISPAEFIPLAEKSGLIIELGDWVIGEACRIAAELNQEFTRDAGQKLDPIFTHSLVFSLNVSPVQFSRQDFVASVRNAIDKYAVNPQSIEIEITENLLVNESVHLFDTLQALKKNGLLISIDDFGTGYSNLSYLKKLAVDVIKIDQSFVRHLVESLEDEAIVNAVVQMARSLNIRSVAEGIEDLATANRLKQLGCEMGQGYFWAKPMPIKEFKKWCLNHQIAIKQNAGQARSNSS